MLHAIHFSTEKSRLIRLVISSSMDENIEKSHLPTNL